MRFGVRCGLITHIKKDAVGKLNAWNTTEGGVKETQ